MSRAFSTARSGDTVIVGAGKYGSASKPVPDFFIGDSLLLTIRGEAGKPAPVIYTGQGTRIDVPDNSTMSRLAIRHTGDSTAFYVGVGAVADHVSVVAGQGAPSACLVFGGTLVDSSCFATGDDGVAVNADDFDGSASTVRLNGVDAVASGEDGVAVHAGAAYGGTLTVNITNTIMEGSQDDLYDGASDVVDTSIVNTDHSDYVTMATDPSGDGSQAVHSSHDVMTRPKLRDVLAGDFRERVSSPTIDAGTAARAPRTDLGGEQRTAGRTTDIGAYEFEPAPAPALKHPHLSRAHGGVLAVVRVNPGRLATTVRLVAVHGGRRTLGRPKRVGAGDSFTRVRLSLSSLHSGTTYRVYIHATNSGGSTRTKPRAVKSR